MAYSIYTIIFGVCFAILGSLTISTIKKYYVDFYNNYKVLLIISTIGLSVPVIAKGALILYTLIADDMSEFSGYFSCNFDQKRKVLSYILFIAFAIIPLGFQLSGLIYGYIRYMKSGVKEAISEALSPTD